MDLRQKFKTDTGLEIDINTPVFAHSVTHINREYVLWLEKQLKNTIVLPDDKVIKDRIEQQEEQHLTGMRTQYNDVVTIEFAAMCCANSFDDAIRWIKENNSYE